MTRLVVRIQCRSLHSNCEAFTQAARERKEEAEVRLWPEEKFLLTEVPPFGNIWGRTCISHVTIVVDSVKILKLYSKTSSDRSGRICEGRCPGFHIGSRARYVDRSKTMNVGLPLQWWDFLCASVMQHRSPNTNEAVDCTTVLDKFTVVIFSSRFSFVRPC